MKRAFIGLAVVFLLGACGGSSGVDQASPTTSALATTAGATTSDRAGTDQPTSAPETTEAKTTVPSTTVAPELMPALADLATPVAEGFRFVPEELGAASGLEWALLADPTEGLFTGAAAFSAAGHAGNGHVVLLKVDPAKMDASVEGTVAEALVRRAAASEGQAGGTTDDQAMLLVQRAVQGRAVSEPWDAWYHDGVVTVVSSRGAATLDDLAVKLVEVQHLHPAYTSGADAEGDLAAVFGGLTLPAGCELRDPRLADQDRIDLAGAWAADPAVQHVAARAVVCGGKFLAVLSIADLHPEFVANADIRADLALRGVPGAAVDEVQGVLFVPDTGGLLWFQDGDYFQIYSEEPGAAVMLAEVMASIAHVST